MEEVGEVPLQAFIVVNESHKFEYLDLVDAGYPIPSMYKQER